jgi:hypothetical protein
MQAPTLSLPCVAVARQALPALIAELRRRQADDAIIVG